jgi:hypothetical protein
MGAGTEKKGGRDQRIRREGGREKESGGGRVWGHKTDAEIVKIQPDNERDRNRERQG